MLPTITVFTKIEILAPPAVVKSVFLDFPSYKQWHQGWDIKPIDSGKEPLELKKGDNLKVDMHGMAFHPSVAENSIDCFSWDRSLYGLVGGKHDFIFAPSKENPGSTTFIQKEDYHGLLMVFFWPWSFKQWSSPNFEALNTALKKEAEKSSQT